MLHNVTRLAVQGFADQFQAAEAHRFGFIGFQYAEIGQGNAGFFRQFRETHFALSHNHVEVDDDGHGFKRLSPVRF